MIKRVHQTLIFFKRNLVHASDVHSLANSRGCFPTLSLLSQDVNPAVRSRVSSKTFEQPYHQTTLEMATLNSNMLLDINLRTMWLAIKNSLHSHLPWHIVLDIVFEWFKMYQHSWSLLGFLMYNSCTSAEINVAVNQAEKESQ